MNLAKRLIIIDGFNVLRCGERYKPLSGKAPNFNDWQDEPFNHAREALMNDAVSLADKNTKIVVVFDGTNNLYSKAKPQKFGDIDVIFSSYCFSADEEIIKQVFNNKNTDLKITIVSDDLKIQDCFNSINITNMSTATFCQVINFEKSNIEETSQERFTNKSEEKIINLIDKGTANKLDQLFLELLE